jgi:glycosyltransferase involved in cell wall biosynthesis
LREGQEIILYGAGRRCIAILGKLRQAGIRIRAIVDGSKPMWGKALEGIVIQPPSAIGRNLDLVLCITVKDSEEQERIRNDLRETYGSGSLKEICYEDLEQEVALLIYKAKADQIDFTKRGPHIVFDCTSGLGLGGIEEWTKGLCLDLRMEGFDNIRILTDTGDYQIPDKLLDIVDGAFDKERYRSREQKTDCIINYLLDLLPVIVVIGKPEIFLEAASLLKKAVPDQVRITSVVHNGEEKIYGFYDQYRDYTDAYVGVSEDIKRDLVERGVPADRVFSITCPVPCDKVLTRSYTMDASLPIRIGYAGRVVVLQKRMDLLIKMIEILENSDVNFCMEIAGDGPYREEMQHIVMEEGWDRHVCFLGALDREDIPDFWKRQDICVNIADAEGRCISKLEAMAGGAVPVMTRTAGNPEDIMEGVNGYMVEIGDYGGMAEKIIFLAGHREMLPELGQKAHDTIYSKCRREAHTEFWVNLLSGGLCGVRF